MQEVDVVFFAAAIIAGCLVFIGGYWAGRTEREMLRAEREATKRIRENPPPVLDVLKPQMPVDRVCSRCGAAFRRHPAVISMLCSACEDKRFAELEASDRSEWEDGGKIVARDWEKS